MRDVVCTVVHHPADARIFYREIRALLDAGHDVTYIAPHGEPGQRPVQDQDQDFPERSRASTGAAPDTAATPGDRPPGVLRTVAATVTLIENREKGEATAGECIILALV